MPMNVCDINVNIDSDNGLLTSGDNILPEPLLTVIDVGIWLQKAAMS